MLNISGGIILLAMSLQLTNAQLTYSLCYLPQSGGTSGGGFVDLAGPSMSFSSQGNSLAPSTDPVVQTLSVAACDANIPSGSGTAPSVVPAALLRCSKRISGKQLELILSGQSNKAIDFRNTKSLENSLSRMSAGITVDVVLTGSCLQRRSLPLLYPNVNYLAVVAFDLKSSSAARSVGEYEVSPIVFIPTQNAKASQAVKVLYDLVPCDSASALTLSGEPCSATSAARIKQAVQAVGMQASTLAYTKILSESN